jgi:uroporphyrinogen decarboxylase
MNQRERFLAVYNYKPVDRCPIWDFGFWDETLELWRAEQGMPRGIEPDDFFGMDKQWIMTPFYLSLLPGFATKLISENDKEKIVLEGSGVVTRWSKGGTTMPEYLDYTLKDRKSWDEQYKWRLDPDTPGRITGAFVGRCHNEWKDSERDFPVIVRLGSVLGELRNYLGLENFSYIQFDDPALFREMVETVGNCIAVTLDRALTYADQAGTTFDMGHFWEDICYNHGPLVNPKTFREVAMPQIKRITDVARKHGVPVISVDCDGKVDELILPWREAGVETMFPIEIGDWADPLELRRRFGKELLMMGGVDKRVMARSRQEIDAMIDHLTPLVEQGGFLPTPDHRVPSDVPLDNYIYFLNRIKKVWGKSLPDVRPTGTPVLPAKGKAKAAKKK